MAFTRVLCVLFAVDPAHGRRIMSSIDVTSNSTGACDGLNPAWTTWGSGKMFDIDAADSACNACTARPNCQWCPLDSKCTPKGRSCKQRRVDGEKNPADGAVSNSAQCSASNGWYEDFLKRSLGANWESHFTQHSDFEISGPLVAGPLSISAADAQAKCLAMASCVAVNIRSGKAELVGQGLLKRKRGTSAYSSGRLRHLDLKLCAAYVLKWAVPGNPNLKDAEIEKERGEWACVSAMFRRGTLGMLSKMPDDTEDSNVVDMVAEGERYGIRTADKENGRVWADSYSWAPLICELAALRPTWRHHGCHVTGFGLKDFADIRSKGPIRADGSQDVSDDLLLSVQSGPLRNLNPGAGKSGSTFGSTFDGLFKVKFGLVQVAFVQVDEPDALKNLMLGESSKGPAESLGEHFAKNPQSAINRVYGLLRLDVGPVDAFCIWMEDAGYNVDDKAALVASDPTLQAPSVIRYDMKGPNRYRARTNAAGSYTLDRGNFHKDEQHLNLGDEQCLKLRAALKADNDFLDSRNIIDYSYFVEVVRDAKDLECDTQRPLCVKNGDVIYTFTIIDTVRYRSAAFALSHKNYGLEAQAFVDEICPTSDEQAA